MTSAAFIAALKTQLEAALPAVTIHLTEPQDPSAPMVVLVSDRVTSDIAWTRFGPKTTEECVVPGRVWASGATLQDAADSALAIVAVIGEQALTPPQVGEQTRKGNVDTVTWIPLLSDKGGYFVEATYNLAYTSDLT